MQEGQWSLFRRFVGGELISREDIANNPDLSEADLPSICDAFDYLEAQLFIATDTQTGAFQTSKFKLTNRGKEAFDLEFNDRFQEKQKQLRWQFFQDPQPEIRETVSRLIKSATNTNQEVQPMNTELKKSAGNRNVNPLRFYAFFTIVLVVVLIISQGKNTPMIEKQAVSLDQMAGTIQKMDSTLKVIVAEDLKKGSAGSTRSQDKNNNR